ncbi:hypothetical protein ACQ4PT_000948 [Festuca glaucescens]
MKSRHELDTVVPSVGKGGKRPAAAVDELWGFPFQCPICNRTFETAKGVHGHMHIHWERGWRGMEPPRPPSAGELTADGRCSRYVCNQCMAPFDTKQAVGGHRSSHSGKKGCSWLEKQELAEAAAAADARRPVLFDFDLNEPVPEAVEEEESE